MPPLVGSFMVASSQAMPSRLAPLFFPICSPLRAGGPHGLLTFEAFLDVWSFRILCPVVNIGGRSQRAAWVLALCGAARPDKTINWGAWSAIRPEIVHWCCAGMGGARLEGHRAHREAHRYATFDP